MNDELERVWKKEGLSRHFLGGTEENYKTTGIPAEIRTVRLPNTSLECYRCTKLLGGVNDINIVH
jgi:hypothetical protein